MVQFGNQIPYIAVIVQAKCFKSDDHHCQLPLHEKDDNMVINRFFRWLTQPITVGNSWEQCEHAGEEVNSLSHLLALIVPVLSFIEFSLFTDDCSLWLPYTNHYNYSGGYIYIESWTILILPSGFCESIKSKGEKLWPNCKKQLKYKDYKLFRYIFLFLLLLSLPFQQMHSLVTIKPFSFFLYSSKFEHERF